MKMRGIIKMPVTVFTCSRDVRYACELEGEEGRKMQLSEYI